MSRTNTGNPIDSKAFADFEDNVKNLDQAVNAEQDTFQDRLGKSRLTWAGIVKAGTGDAGVIVPIVQQAVQDVIDGVDGQVTVAESAADRAETARDAAFVNADVYPDIAAGLAAVADGEQFQVVEGDDIVRYRRDSASIATPVARLRSPDPYVGAPSVVGARTFTDGSASTGGGRFVLQSALPVGGLGEIELLAKDAGELQICLVSMPNGPGVGESYNLLTPWEVVEVQAGYNRINVQTFWDITDSITHLGFRGAPIPTVNNSPTPTSVSTIGSDESGTVLGETLTYLVNIRANVLPTVSRVSRLSYELDDLNNTLTQQRPIAQWGARGELSDANAINERQWMFEKVFAGEQEVAQVTLYARTSGEIEVSTWSQNGDEFTKKERVTVEFSAGQSTVSLPVSLKVQAGDRIGFWAPGGVLVNDNKSYTQDFVGYRSVVGGKIDSFETSNVQSPYAIQIRFGLVRPFEGPFGELDLKIESTASYLQSQVDDLKEGGKEWGETIGYILVWAVGQSNMAGRGDDPSQYVIASGRGYKYEHSNASLQPLIDPTTSGGGTSPAAAMGHAVLEATNGRIGVILVNTAWGGTSLLNQWAEGGSSWNNSKTAFNNARSLIDSQKLNVVGFAAAMIQGETDGDNGVSTTDYSNALLDLKERMKVHAGVDNLPFIISQIGVRNSSQDPELYAAIRQGQANLARSGEVVMAHSGAKYFVERGMMMDSWHYTAPGYDEIGSSLGYAIYANALGLRPDGLTE